jgi:hypothetical protein
MRQAGLEETNLGSDRYASLDPLLVEGMVNDKVIGATGLPFYEAVEMPPEISSPAKVAGKRFAGVRGKRTLWSSRARPAVRF